jgi:aspartate aminotransferase
MSLSKTIEEIVARSSWIRKMFEEGSRLKAIHGEGQVFDFSLGNPNLPPPARFRETIGEILQSLPPASHGYMPNAGYPFVRKAVAEAVSKEQGHRVSEDHVLMTCGAAGALNVILKSLLNPGDEVLTPAPYFVEYGFYADNHGGVLKPVPTRPDFTLDLSAIAGAVSEKTRAVLINSPNNPTGQIYSAESLAALGKLLSEKSREHHRTITLISDEPYRKIVYNGASVPSIWDAYPESLIVSSFSKDLSLAGERIGYIAVGPEVTDREALVGGMAIANRILGFVNAPGLMQRVVSRIGSATVDVAAYARKRDLLCAGLQRAGYDFVTPPGTFYLFPRTPIPDDVAFVRALQEERILTVPGSGFGAPGHFRIAFCVSDETIENALPGFRRAMAAH